jgi:hypothetical protein
LRTEQGVGKEINVDDSGIGVLISGRWNSFRIVPVAVLILAALYCYNIHSSIYDAVSVKEQATKGQAEVDI